MEVKNVRWTSVGEIDGKLYYFKDGKWIPAVDEGGDLSNYPTKDEMNAAIDAAIGDLETEEF